MHDNLDSQRLDWLKPGWPLIFLFLILSYLIYGHTLHFPFFIFDDNFHILNNDEVRNLTLSNFFHFWFNSKIPIPFNLWQILNVFSEDNPAGFRIVNILLHGGCSYLIFKVFYKMLNVLEKEAFEWIPFIAASFFLLHPLNVESVVWISSLKGILSLFFALLSFNYYLDIESISDQESTKAVVLSVVFYGLSLLSKPVSAVMPIVFMVNDHFILKRSLKKKWPLYVYYVLLTFSLSLLHVKGLENSDLSMIPYTDRAFVAGGALPFYIGKVLYPFELFIIYPKSILSYLQQLTSMDKYKIIMFNFSLFCFLGFYWQKEKYRPQAAGMLFFFLFLIPISGVIPFDYQNISYVSDRYAYHPLFWILPFFNVWSFIFG